MKTLSSSLGIWIHFLKSFSGATLLHHVMLVSSVRFHPRSPVPSPPESGLSVTAHLAPSPSSPSPSPSGDHRPAVCVYEFIAFGFPATQAWNQVVPVRFHLTHFAGREAPASSRADAPGSAPPLLTVVPPHEEHPSPPRCVSRAARGTVWSLRPICVSLRRAAHAAAWALLRGGAGSGHRGVSAVAPTSPFQMPEAPRPPVVRITNVCRHPRCLLGTTWPVIENRRLRCFL